MTTLSSVVLSLKQKIKRVSQKSSVLNSSSEEEDDDLKFGTGEDLKNYTKTAYKSNQHQEMV